MRNWRISTLKVFLILNIFFVATFSYASEALVNTGLVKSGIWYSKDPFFDGEKVRIYTIIFNGSKDDLLGSIQFENNSKMICKGDFSVVAGRTQEFWCDFVAVKGNAKIVAKIVDPKISPVGGSPVAITLENNISGISERYIDADINKNGVPDKTDISKGIDPFKPILVKEISKISNMSASTTGVGAEVERAVSDVNDKIFSVVPKDMLTDKIETVKNIILSYVPENIKKEAKNLSDKAGVFNIKKPFNAVFDFLIAIIVFIKNSTMAFLIIVFILIWFILRAVYNRVTKKY